MINIEAVILFLNSSLTLHILYVIAKVQGEKSL